MHRNLTIDLLVSFLLHGGTLYSDRFISFKSDPKPGQEKEPVESFDPPPIELVELSRPEDAPTDIRFDFTPQRIDIPQVVAEDGFVQQLQPPRPEIVRLNATALDIPLDDGIPGFDSKEIFDVSKLEQRPEARFQPPPQYPIELRRHGIEGNAMVDFLVDRDGRVQNAHAVSATHREFEAAALQAVAKWKFKPGRKNGHDVVTHMQVPIVFTLQ